MRPRTLEETSVTVKDGQNPGEEVCGAVGELAEKHGLTANRAACLDDLSRVTLEDGTEVKIAVTRQWLGAAGSRIIFDQRRFATSIDDKVQKSREQ